MTVRSEQGFGFDYKASMTIISILQRAEPRSHPFITDLSEIVKLFGSGIIEKPATLMNGACACQGAGQKIK
jgi:hypothetical protein